MRLDSFQLGCRVPRKGELGFFAQKEISIVENKLPEWTYDLPVSFGRKENLYDGWIAVRSEPEEFPDIINDHIGRMMKLGLLELLCKAGKVL